ncbi:MAG: hypothetical protein H6818_18915 [Phycisphaerales bacterium]|nr:hypothetical protein [Phycisphaerales bacterium]MCB9863820.1 hypothetical protein [Phycisphaerales bacterium]
MSEVEPVGPSSNDGGRILGSPIAQLCGDLALIIPTIGSAFNLATNIHGVIAEWTIGGFYRTIGAFLATAILGYFSIKRRITRNRYAKRSKELFKLKPNHFRVSPYTNDQSDREAYQRVMREDSVDTEALQWLTDTTAPLLYLTGPSGSGKSSLLRAFVFPALPSRTKIIDLPPSSDPLDSIRSKLYQLLYNQGPQDKSTANPLCTIDEVRVLISEFTRANPTLKLLIVLDQFEDIIALAGPEAPSIKDLIDFLSTLVESPLDSLAVLLVIRTEKSSLLGTLGLPRLTGDDGKGNWKQVPCFSLQGARGYLRKCDVTEELADLLTKRTAELEPESQQIRPFALNIMALACIQSPDEAARNLERRTRRHGKFGVLSGYIRRLLDNPSSRSRESSILRSLVNHEGDRPHMTVTEFASGTGLRSNDIEAAVRELRLTGLVRPVGGPDTQTWEISHGFITEHLLCILPKEAMPRRRTLGRRIAFILLWAVIAVVAFVSLREFYFQPEKDLEVGKVTFELCGGKIHGHEGNITLTFKRPEFDDRTIQYVSTLPQWKLLNIVDLSGSRVTGSSLTLLGGLPHLENLYLVDCGSLDAEGLTELARFSSLTELHLGGDVATPVDVRWMANDEMQLTGLKTLSFSGGVLTNESLRALAAKDSPLTALESLHFWRTQISNEGFRVLAGLESGLDQVTTLDLQGTTVSVDGIRALAANTTRFASIKNLSLKNTGLTNEGVEALASPDSGLSALAALNLSSNLISDKGIRALASADSGLRALAELVISDNKRLTNKGIMAIASKDSGVGKLRTLVLQGEEVSDDWIMALVAKDSALGQLQTLDISYSKVSDTGLMALAAKGTGLDSLRVLRMTRTGVTDDGLRALAANGTQLATLAELDLSETLVADRGLQALAARNTGLKELRILELARTGITDKGLVALAASDSGLRLLATLNLRQTQVTDLGLKVLGSKDTELGDLTVLDLSYTKVTDVGVRDLAVKGSGLRSMATLVLNGTDVSDRGLRALAASDSGLSTLTTLYLSSTSVTDDGLRALAGKDSGLRALTKLYLGQTSVTDAAISMLRRARPNLEIFH